MMKPGDISKCQRLLLRHNAQRSASETSTNQVEAWGWCLANQSPKTERTLSLDLQEHIRNHLSLSMRHAQRREASFQ
jgi:hypothetical protein